MEAFCDELRAEREQRQMSLATVSEVTKVPQRHLRALEEGRFADLPGGIFRKGILRSYLQAIGVDAAPWIARFEVCLAALDVVVEPPVELEQIAAGVERTRTAEAVTQTRTGWSGVVFALMLLLAFGWCVWRYALRGRVVLSSVTPAVTRSVAGAERGSPVPVIDR